MIPDGRPQQKVGLTRAKKPAVGKSKDQLQRMKARLRALEEEIARLEIDARGVEQRLSDRGVDPGEVQQLASEYARLQAQLEAKIELWSDLGDELSEP